VAAVKVKNLPLALTLQKNQEPFQYEIFQCLACYSSHEEGREPAGLTSHGRRVQVARPLKNQKKLAACIYTKYSKYCGPLQLRDPTVIMNFHIIVW
jgi:hypothetical protein